MRYQSAHGLKSDLLECQRRLLAVVSSLSAEPQEVSPDTLYLDPYLHARPHTVDSVF
jgi:hypothetical protein